MRGTLWSTPTWSQESDDCVLVSRFQHKLLPRGKLYRWAGNMYQQCTSSSSLVSLLPFDAIGWVLIRHKIQSVYWCMPCSKNDDSTPPLQKSPTFHPPSLITPLNRHEFVQLPLLKQLRYPSHNDSEPPQCASSPSAYRGIWCIS